MHHSRGKAPPPAGIVGFRSRDGTSGTGRPLKFYTAGLDEVLASVPERSYELAEELLASAATRSMELGEPIAESLQKVGREQARPSVGGTRASRPYWRPPAMPPSPAAGTRRGASSSPTARSMSSPRRTASSCARSTEPSWKARLKAAGARPAASSPLSRAWGWANAAPGSSLPNLVRNALATVGPGVSLCSRWPLLAPLRPGGPSMGSVLSERTGRDSMSSNGSAVNPREDTQ